MLYKQMTEALSPAQVEAGVQRGPILDLPNDVKLEYEGALVDLGTTGRIAE